MKDARIMHKYKYFLTILIYCKQKNISFGPKVLLFIIICVSLQNKD